MNKLLSSATAIAMLACATASHAAEPQGATPSLTISGETNGTYYAFRSSQREAKGGRGNGHLVRAENSRLNFDVFGKAENWGGLEYSFLIGLSGNTEDSKTAAEETRLKLKGQWGTFMIGTHRGVDHIMPFGAYNTTGGTGGVLGGNYKEVIAGATGVNYSVDMVGTVKDTNRITYVTPRISGFQFGVSMAPLGHVKGEGSPNSYKNPSSSGSTFSRNIWSLGLNFKRQLNGDWGIKLSAVGTFSKTESGTDRGVSNIMAARYGNNANINLDKYKRTASYAVGGVVSYKNFDFGVEFIDNGQSMVLADIPGAKAGQVTSFGMAYRMGDDSFSIGYLYGSKRLGDFKKNGHNPRATAKAVHLSWDRTLAPGLGIFAEGVYFDHRTDQAALDFQKTAKVTKSTLDAPVGTNHGHVLLTGVKVRF